MLAIKYFKLRQFWCIDWVNSRTRVEEGHCEYIVTVCVCVYFLTSLSCRQTCEQNMESENSVTFRKRLKLSLLAIIQVIYVVCYSLILSSKSQSEALSWIHDWETWPIFCLGVGKDRLTCGVMHCKNIVRLQDPICDIFF